MKMAFLFGTMHRGGAERVIASLANTYCVQDNDISIITLDNSPSGYPLDERVKHIRLNLAGNSKTKWEAISRNLKIILQLRKVILQHKYDAVITFELRLAVFLQYAFPFGRKFKIITSERANPNVRNLGRFEQTQRDLALPRVDGFIFQTERVSLCYSEKLRQIGTVIHNGVFPEILPENPCEFENRNHTDICAVGRLTKQKGYDILLQAYSLFRETHPTHHLHIYGEGGLRESIEQLIDELNLQEAVTLHGSVPNVMFQVQSAGMFVLPSRFEGMPNALMEAMACGLPCIAADCDFGPAELIIDGENGLLVPTEDPTALAEAMSRLADDKTLAQTLSKNALRIRHTHNGKQIAQQYYDYIVSIINK